MNMAHLGGQTSAMSAGAMAWLVVAWFAMMSAMMAPAVWPWVLAFRRFGLHQTGPEPRAGGTAIFGSGYLAAWLIYSVAAAAVQIALTRWRVFDPAVSSTPLVAAAVLVGAGLFQFASFKRACLTHCRNPLTYFLARWRNGPAHAFRLGFEHGLFCVGCCWALMGTALVVGMTNLCWMAALALAAFLEQVAPRGDRVRALVGIALVIAGVATVAV